MIFIQSSQKEDVGQASTNIQPLGRVVLGNHPRKDESFKINQKSKQSMFLIYFDYLIIFIQKLPMGKKLKETDINTI